jgi:8-oxo-dGTP pyrophosphatase MutT (NUDIX family)
MKEYRSTQDWPYSISCGGAVYRIVDGQRQYALLYRGESYGKWGNSWHLPKGTLEEGEPIEQCAKREVREETGYEGEIEAYLGSLHHSWVSEKLGRAIDKTVHFFLFRQTGGDSADMDKEHDALEWFPAEEAKEKLNSIPRRDEAAIIDRAEAWLRKV